MLFASKASTEEEDIPLYLTVIVRDSQKEPGGRIIVQADTEDLYVVFCEQKEGSYDFDNSEALTPDSFDRADSRQVHTIFEFEGKDFLDKMLTHDAMFVSHIDGNGNYESCMIRLEKFHRQYLRM